MKKRKSLHKLMASLLSMTMLPIMSPLQNVKAASQNLFTEDFESYATGIVRVEGNKAYDSEGTQITGAVATVIGDDYFEIVEEDGNKYLKMFTKRNSSTSSRTRIRFSFGTTLSGGKKEISYKYRTIAHYAAFLRMGCVYTDENSYASTGIQRIMSQGDNIISKLQTVIFGWTNDLSSANFLDGFGTITQIIDYDSTENNYTISIEHDNATRTKTFTIADLATKTAKGICWDFSSAESGGANGKDAAIDGYGVYCIDDVTVNTEGMYVAGASVEDGGVISANDLVELTFDDIVADDVTDHITIYKNGEDSSVDDYEIGIYDDTITVMGFDYNCVYDIKIDSQLKSYDGKPMVADYELNFSTESVIEHNVTRTRYETEFTPSINPVDGINYTYFISKDGGDYAEYDLSRLNEKGEYSLKIVAVDENGKGQTEIVTFLIVEASAPEIRDISIECMGELKEGTALNGVYTYFDGDEIPDENKDYCVFKWYRSETKDGEYTPIEGADAQSYTLTSEDEDSYIKLGIKPFSKVEPKEGEEYLSEPFISFMNPSVTDISITGKMATDEQLTVSYLYSDLNEDEEITEGENATAVIWYTSQSSEGQFAEVGRGRSYTIKEEDSNKWFKVAVIPKNNGGGKQEKEFESKPVEGAFSPTAVDVKINGNLNVGSKVGVDYRFYDINNDTEHGSVIEWYVGGKLVSTDDHYTISSNDAGKSIYVSVTPKSSTEPAMGETVTSESKTIKKKANTVSSGGGGGGGGSASKPTTNVTPSVPNVNPPAPNVPDEKNEGFTDISGHWAKDIILKMVEKGIIYGKTDTEFAPEDKITRAEFATLISRMFNLSGSEYAFNDVKKESWYAQSVSAVASAGFMSGFDGNFRPEENITREEMAVVISSITAKNEIEDEEKNIVFADEENISQWAKDAVRVTANLGIIQGMDDNKFVPEGDASRAQTVVMLARLQAVLGQ